MKEIKNVPVNSVMESKIFSKKNAKAPLIASMICTIKKLCGTVLLLMKKAILVVMTWLNSSFSTLANSMMTFRK